jgi:hypothetical protein
MAWRRLASGVEADTYGGRTPSPEAQRQMVILARRIPRGRRSAPPQLS